MSDQIKLGSDETIELLGNGLFRVVKKPKLDIVMDSEPIESGSSTETVQTVQKDPLSSIEGNHMCYN